MLRKTLEGIFLLGLSFCLDQGARAQELFPTSPVLDKQIRFWESIFSEYSSSYIVIHDRSEPHIVLGTIHLPSRGYANTLSPGIGKLSEREELLYSQVVASFTDGASAKNRSSLHLQVWKAYSRDKTALERLLRGEVKIRSQGGLADTFKKALKTSELYLPRMEKIFREHQLPRELTRLVFVESMFNLHARSKVGASGFWQLMPGSARPHIRVDRTVDERNSPYLATKAAARIMSQNYSALGSWPLAITAYNHGLGGMRRAVEQVGSRDLGELVTAYQSPSFGFASQNFYAEFVAALRTYEKLTRGKNPPKIASEPLPRRSTRSN